MQAERHFRRSGRGEWIEGGFENTISKVFTSQAGSSLSHRTSIQSGDVLVALNNVHLERAEHLKVVNHLSKGLKRREMLVTVNVCLYWDGDFAIWRHEFRASERVFTSRRRTNESPEDADGNRE